MSEEKVPIITDRKEIYEKCENMEQLFDKYYLPLLIKHFEEIYELQQENQQLKEQINILECLIESLKLGVTLNSKQEALLDKIMLGSDK